MGHLDGRVAIVTGAGRGIGRGEALCLAAEGAAVIVNDLGAANDGTGADAGPAAEVVAQIEANGGRAVADASDIGTWAGGEAVVKRALDSFGRLDVLVCNAGIVRDRMVFNISESEWDDVIRVHVKGHVAPTRFATAHWRQQFKEAGEPVNARIVYTSSHVGLFGNVGQVNYSAAKAAIASLGLSVAREMARFGVTCNNICPGARTRLVDATFPGQFDGDADAEWDPMSPDNIGPLVAYLASDEAAHISGQTFGISGSSVELLVGWTSAATVDNGGRWTVDDLVKRTHDLFGDRPTGPAASLADLGTL